MNWTPEDVLTTDKYLSLENENIAYIKTDVLTLDHPIYWRGRMHDKRPAPIWITGHSDYPITTNILHKFGRHCRFWAGINKDVDDDKVMALPLGITNDCNDTPLHPILGNNEIMWEVSQKPRNISGLLYANFVVNTYPSVREPLMNWLKTLSWVDIGVPAPTLESRRKFLEEIRSHKFTICPRGNGIDTHRLWETLYVGGIPIVVRALALKEFEDLPICWVDSFYTLTPEFLEAEYQRITSPENKWNWDKLKFSYWKNRILSLQEKL